MFAVEGSETHRIFCWALGLRETKPINLGVTKLRETKPIQCLGIEGGSLEEGNFGCLRLREGKLTYCWAKGLREMKPINVGSLKAEGNETNTVLGY